MFNYQATSKIIVLLNKNKDTEQIYTFSKSFRIGRDKSNDVCINDPLVSAFHIEVLRKDGGWWLHDIHSTNGTFADGRLINKIELNRSKTIQLGQRGPLVSLQIAEATAMNAASLFAKTLIGTFAKSLPASTQILRNYFSKSIPQKAGHYTVNLHNAINKAIKRRSKKFLAVIGVLSVIAVGAIITAWVQHKRLTQVEPLGIELFYNMKSLELQIQNLAEKLSNSEDPKISDEINSLKAQYVNLTHEYENFVEKSGIYDGDMSEEERLILKIARIFGECEINAPPDFTEEVKKYIHKWRTTERLEQSIRKSVTNGYVKGIAQTFLNYNLPPQFFYLALQESGFDLHSCGPKTRYGIAKGMWQFMPKTAAAYGLKIGPLRQISRPDPRDERHDFIKSTEAAAKLIRDLYNTKAQGSGLLVLASYNWGIGNLQAEINKMPMNPRDRNFWNLVKNHTIPQQTYDFVFYIISAAVIGENPELFGFSFKNLLENIS